MLPEVRLQKLHDELKPKYVKHKNYIQKIIAEYQYILNADPQQMKRLIAEFNIILPRHELLLNIRKNKRILFHEAVVHALRYEDLRNKEIIKYLKYSGIKTCVYCNLQSTLIVEPNYYDKKRKKVKNLKAKLQLDHYYPKSKYPFLSTSTFNLYPTCANCNLAKGQKIFFV